MTSQIESDLTYDAGPTGCGELIMNLFLTMKKMKDGQVIKVISYDPGAREDLPAWCRLQKHTLLRRDDEGKVSHYYIQKGK
ncbi:sulfurtransferase TusA family protein [Robertmurraya andreesenii]|uniref:tRNA 2-thiouridine synthesizing protein A n=1 Tax=Anoxybacillus andreesenii TaxID=1325932 RepID=A0ABT9V5I8_9BACL|nr:sulfurtransferase TusA family protein [Robertmurraya andreesenii]MDQ0156207.1 tRNA 2-thiouridine synthesizing protein A [Robertmurraya andreesenii]